MLAGSTGLPSFAVVGCVCALLASVAIAQSSGVTTLDREDLFTLHNRTLEVLPGGVVHLDAREGEGFAWVSGARFTEGRVGIEVKGLDQMGRSFVGLAFRGSEDRTRYEAVYLRPFNFQAATLERRSHALQYISMPDHTWPLLRERFPGKYESALVPSPLPDAWVRLTLDVEHDKLRIFIDDAATPTMTVTLLGTHEGDAIALWVGNNSEGWFRNLRIEDPATH